MAIWMHDFMRCSSALDVDFRDVCLFKLYMLMVIEKKQKKIIKNNQKIMK
jgi:hypothetical protein